jgi:hypothetical protein
MNIRNARVRNRFASTALLGISLSLAACKPSLPEKMEISETRPTFSLDGPIPEPAATAQRLGFRSQASFRWTAPPGWKLMPSTEFRDLNFSFGPNGEGECYMAFTKGEEGATVTELNRWRKQMAQPPVEIDAIANLPRVTLFNRECPLVQLEGDYTPASSMAMMGAPPMPAKPGQGMIGTILEVPQMQAVVTIKLIAPKEMAQQQLENFKAFVSSLGQVSATTAATGS